jgi:protoporphyrinogen oxidase
LRIAIIGAGLTGLSAAINLREFADVVLFEKSETGGLASSYCREYCIEKFYHHCFRNDFELIKMIKNLKLSSKLVWKVARVAYAVDGNIFPLNTPFEILKYPHMKLTDKLRLAIFTLKSKKRNYREKDDISVEDGIKEELGESLFNSFFYPLLRSKFGENYGEISYAWLLARVAIRSNRKYSGEELGYLRHGFHQMIERMEEGLDIRKGRVKISKNGKFVVNSGEFDNVIFTAPLPELDSRIHVSANLPPIKYQSSVCALIGAEKTVTEDIYWTNVRDRLSFGAIVEHTNFMPFEDYGEHLIYLASYSTPNGNLFSKGDEKLKKLYLNDLEKFGLNAKDINWIKIFKARYSSPIYEKGYIQNIIPYRTDLEGFYVAGMISKPNYPERSMNGSIKSGLEVAEVVKRDSGFD